MFQCTRWKDLAAKVFWRVYAFPFPPFPSSLLVKYFNFLIFAWEKTGAWHTNSMHQVSQGPVVTQDVESSSMQTKQFFFPRNRNPVRFSWATTNQYHKISRGSSQGPWNPCDWEKASTHLWHWFWIVVVELSQKILRFLQDPWSAFKLRRTWVPPKNLWTGIPCKKN